MIHVAIVDARRLRILEQDPDGALIETESLEDRAAFSHERDYVADRPGRMIKAVSGSHVALAPRHTAQSIALQRWLKLVGRQLRDVLEAGRCEGIVLVASSRLMGLLRVCLPPDVRRGVILEVKRDLAKQAPLTLEKRLRPALLEARDRLRFHSPRLMQASRRLR